MTFIAGNQQNKLLSLPVRVGGKHKLWYSGVDVCDRFSSIASSLLRVKGKVLLASFAIKAPETEMLLFENRP